MANTKAINTLGVGNLDGRIAPSLKSIGYVTKTFSTSKRDFYGAERFHKSLGIDQYYSIENTPDDGKRFIGYKDSNLFTYLQKNIERETSPSFIFVTTELNHAPHNIKVDTSHLPCADLTAIKCALIYDYHLREEAFSEILSKFLHSLSNNSRESIVVLFGDHIPADINSEFSDIDFKNKKFETIALFYSTKSSRFINLERFLGCKLDDLEISDLDVIALKLANLSSTYSDSKFHSKILSKCN